MPHPKVCRSDAVRTRTQYAGRPRARRPGRAPPHPGRSEQAHAGATTNNNNNNNNINNDNYNDNNNDNNNDIVMLILILISVSYPSLVLFC